MNNGWIKLHRKILDNPISKRPQWAWLWVILLILANHDEEHTFIWNGNQTKLKQGQFVTGRKALSEKSGVPESTVEDILRYLENSCQIRQQKTTKYRLITILNWETYQKSDNKATTKQQQADTFNNTRNKEDKNTSDVPSLQIQSLINLFKDINPSYQRLFGNVTERNCAARLITQHGYEKMERTLIALPEILSKPYAPRITTPYELEKNLGKLLQFIKQSSSLVKKADIAFT